MWRERVLRPKLDILLTVRNFSLTFFKETELTYMVTNRQIV